MTKNSVEWKEAPVSLKHTKQTVEEYEKVGAETTKAALEELAKMMEEGSAASQPCKVC